MAERGKKGVKIVQEDFIDISIIPRSIAEVFQEESIKWTTMWMEREREEIMNAGKPSRRSFLLTADGGGCLWLLVACAHTLECIWVPFLSGDPGQ